MVKSVNTRDLKSLAKSLSVRVRLGACGKHPWCQRLAQETFNLLGLGSNPSGCIIRQWPNGEGSGLIYRRCVGSSPTWRTCERSSMARVPAFQAGCCGFESHRSLCCCSTFTFNQG